MSTTTNGTEEARVASTGRPDAPKTVGARLRGLATGLSSSISASSALGIGLGLIALHIALALLAPLLSLIHI